MTEEIGYHRRRAARAAGTPVSDPAPVPLITPAEILPAIPYIPAGEVGNPQPRPMKPATPELDRRHHVIESERHRGVVDLLEWLDGEGRSEHGYALVRYRQGEPEELGSSSFERVLAAFYGLDLDKIEAEKMSLLEYMREINKT